MDKRTLLNNLNALQENDPATFQNYKFVVICERDGDMICDAYITVGVIHRFARRLQFIIVYNMTQDWITNIYPIEGNLSLGDMIGFNKAIKGVV